MAIVKVVNQDAQEQMIFGEMVFGSKKVPSFEGKLLAINPSKEEYATFDENFRLLVEDGRARDVMVGVVYYDENCERAFFLPHEVVQITSVEN